MRDPDVYGECGPSPSRKADSSSAMKIPATHRLTPLETKLLHALQEVLQGRIVVYWLVKKPKEKA
jgi:hypothetical protein